MGYEPTVDAPVPLFPSEDRPIQVRITMPSLNPPARKAGPRPLVARKQLRFGGLSLDTLTGAVQWRGKQLSLAEDERELLAVLMENAGRILSLSQIAIRLGERLDTTERRLHDLHLALRAVGVPCLPRKAEGLGYILWH